MARSDVLVSVALARMGDSRASVLAKLIAQGVQDAAEVVAAAFLAAQRLSAPGQPDVYKHRLGLFTSAPGRAQGNLRVRDALCQDLQGAGGPWAADLARARAAEANCFTVEYVDGGQVVRGYYAEGTFRDRDRDLLLAAVDMGPPNILLEVGDPAVILANIAGRGLTKRLDP